MNFRRLLIGFCLLPIAVVIPSWGQGKTVNKSSTTSKSDSRYDRRPFNEHAESLPTNYSGHDVESVFRHLVKAIPRKSEFETTDDYQVRAMRQITQPLPNNIPFDSLLAFRVPNDRFEIKYDADEQMLGLAVAISPPVEGSDNDLDHEKQSIQLKERVVLTKSGVGSNAFGVRARVRTTVEETFEIAFSGDSNVAIHRYSGNKYYLIGGEAIYYRAPMSPPLARSVKDRLRVLVISKIELPLVSSGVWTTEATISRPRSRIITNHYLHVVPYEVWAYDPTSGIVYYKFAGKQLLFSKEARDEALRAEREAASEQERKNILQQAVELKRAKAREGLEPPKIISQPRAAYPTEALRNKVEGTVVLRVTFLASGQIGQVEVETGLSHGLTEEAIKAAKQISFEPAKKNGVPIDMTRRIEYGFINH